MRPKQVIIIRDDLRNVEGNKLRKGKMIAQGAHASLAVILNKMNRENTEGGYTLTLDVEDESPLDQWISQQFTKITLKCNSEEELVELYTKAKEAGLNTVLITDSGFTEFGGIPTKTCIAIGPDNPELIDEITKNLSLY